MRTVSDIIDGLGGNTAVARIIGKGPSTVSEMKRRGAVPVEYWPVLVAAAQDDELARKDNRPAFILTNDILVSVHVGEVAA